MSATIHEKIGAPMEEINSDEDESPMESPFEIFEDMALNQKLLEGIKAYGLEKPNALQRQAIVPMIRGGDILVQAPSGTGKTTSLAIALLRRMDFKPDIDVRQRNLQALVLTPTREAAQQTHAVITQIGKFLSYTPSFCENFVGGNSCARIDGKKLQSGKVMVTVGTPGRLSDLKKRGNLPTEHIRTIILDEAGDLLSPVFIEQVYEVLTSAPKDVQVALFSSTVLSQSTLDLTKKFLRSPTVVEIRESPTPLAGIRQYYSSLEEDRKIDALMKIYSVESGSGEDKTEPSSDNNNNDNNNPLRQSIIFANNCLKIDWIADKLRADGRTVSCLHGEMMHFDREASVANFRSGSSRILVCTDLALSMGVEADVVINYDLPSRVDSYPRRIGRGGCRDRKRVFNFVSPKDVEVFCEIEGKFQTKVEEVQPSGIFAKNL